MGRPEFNNYTFYKFSCLTDNVECCYVGSTANFLARQLCHKSVCNNTNNKNYNNKLYETIRANGGWNNWKMVIIGELKNINLKEARIKEEEYRVNLKAELNTRRAYISDEIKKEYMNEYAKKYYETNIKVIKERQKKIGKKYYETNKETIKERHKECSKKYYETHKEQLKEYGRQYYLKNKLNKLEN